MWALSIQYSMLNNVYSTISKMRVLMLYTVIQLVRALEVKERIEVQYSSVQITN